MADNGWMFQSRVERTRSSASCTSLDAQGQCALNTESRSATRARPGDHVSTCLHARTKHASGMAWRSAGESRLPVLPDALVSAVCWPTSEKGELASNPSTLTRGFAPGCLHAFSKNLSRREMASVAVLGDDAGWRLLRLPIEERPRVLAPSASAENGEREAVVFQWSRRGVESEHPLELALAQDPFALLGPAQHHPADDPGSSARDHGQHYERPGFEAGHQVGRGVTAGPEEGARGARRHVCVLPLGLVVCAVTVCGVQSSYYIYIAPSYLKGEPDQLQGQIRPLPFNHSRNQNLVLQKSGLGIPASI